jgi:hypothetical protein
MSVDIRCEVGSLVVLSGSFWFVAIVRSAGFNPNPSLMIRLRTRHADAIPPVCRMEDDSKHHN